MRAPASASKAVDACIEVMRTQAASTDPARAGKMSRGCAAVYKDPTCRDAHLKTDEVEPAKRALTLTRACAQAYCPKLPEPRPKLCDPDLDKPGDLAELWWELRLEIWKLDLGAAESQRLEKEMLHAAAQAQQR